MTRNNILNYSVVTSVKDTTILQVVGAEGVTGLDTHRDLISKRVVETQDAQMRKALIDLGWSPPEATTAAKEALEKVEKIYLLHKAMVEDPTMYKHWAAAQNEAPKLIEKALKELRGE